MDQTELKEFVVSLFKQNLIPIVLFCTGLLFLCYGLISLFYFSKKDSLVVFEPAKKEQPASEDKSKKTIIVDIEGAVMRPGVYSLNADARLQDGLIKSGGFSDKADRREIAQSMNLASRLTDGAKIYVPFIGEKSVMGANTSNYATTSSGLININTATESELDSLPGVGGVTAQKIIQNRPYTKIQELLDKKAVGAKVFSDIEKKISAN